MKIVLFGGTTEGRELSRLLASAGAELTVCVATEYGDEEQGSFPGVTTHVGALDASEKAELLKDALCCVDATHPYALHVSAAVRAACERAGVTYYRLCRPPSKMRGALSFKEAARAAEWLADKEGNVLLTTGAKELPAFARLDPARLFPRILPNHESLSACEALGIPHRNIIAMQGPFTREINAATIRQYNVRFLVTKDGGGPGGFPEKAAAARETGARLLVLCRPEESGLSFDEVFKLCISRLRDANNE